MTNEQRPLGTFSDEIDRVLRHADSRFDAIDVRLVDLTAQVTATNGRVRSLEGWREYLKGVSAGAGGSGRLLLVVYGAAATLIGMAGTLFGMTR